MKEHTTVSLMGTRLRREREERGLSRPELARLILAALPADDRQRPSVDGMVHYIARWETGRVRSVSNRYQRAYAAALGMNRRRLFSASRITSNSVLFERPPGQWTDPSETLTPRSDRTATMVTVQDGSTIGDDVSWQALLRLLAAASTRAAAPVEDLRTVFGEIENAITDRTDFKSREHTPAEHAQAGTISPGTLVEELSRDLIAIGILLRRRHAPSIQTDLLRVAADLSGQLAAEFTDIGDEHAAQIAWRSADAPTNRPPQTNHQHTSERSDRDHCSTHDNSTGADPGP